jgi:hypothetical protein
MIVEVMMEIMAFFICLKIVMLNIFSSRDKFK